MKILNTKYIKVQQVDRKKYLTWTSTIYILFKPKVLFELTENGIIKNYKIKHFWLSILLNLVFLIIVWILYLYIEDLSFRDTIDSFLLVIFGFLILFIIVNFLNVRTIKREVKKQIQR
tara:strand:+ start:619 stop:972 length:354 start_codon:yes stop_codon:yes gene_type:complete